MRCLISILWGISRSFLRLSLCSGHVAHALRTLAPVAAISIATHALPLDLHVLSLPLAFILSQDQTLHCIFDFFISQLVYIIQKRIALACFYCLLCYNFSTCLYFCLPSFQWTLPTVSERDCKDTHFLFPTKFFATFFHFSSKFTPRWPVDGINSVSRRSMRGLGTGLGKPHPIPHQRYRGGHLRSCLKFESNLNSF